MQELLGALSLRRRLLSRSGPPRPHRLRPKRGAPVMSDNPLKSMKLFPRNLTARADTVVRGNPVTTRPESGVDNAWPGLEFDHRGMEKFFFPGLVFEFHD